MFTYHYSGAGALVRQLDLPGGSVRTNCFGSSGELLRTQLKGPSGGLLEEHGYGYDLSFLRTQGTRLGGVDLSYSYDPICQLTNVAAWEQNRAITRLNESFGYGYDPAGNLRGKVNGATTVSYFSDRLNQLTNATRGGSMTASGSLGTNAANVTVNDIGARVYQDLTFSTTSPVPLADGSNTFLTRAVDAQSLTNVALTTMVLPVSVNLLYDSNGNLTNDGLRRFEYDGADRLAAVDVPNNWRTEFSYDGLSRRRITREYAWQGGAWSLTNETRFVYSGWLVVQERNGANSPAVTYTRGLDLSGTWEGAGGIGGLLARTDANGVAFYHSDGAGNIITLINAQGEKRASYLYDSFGNLVDKRGPLADANLYRFSSKEHHHYSGLYYYGFRFYEPNLQRWLNPDPIEERSINPFAFVWNNPFDWVDPDGLQGTPVLRPGPRVTARPNPRQQPRTFPEQQRQMELDLRMELNTRRAEEVYERERSPHVRSPIPELRELRPKQPESPSNVPKNSCPATSGSNRNAPNYKVTGYPLAPQYPPPTRVGENFQFNFDISQNYRNSRAAGVREAREQGIIRPGEIGHHANSVRTHPHLAAEPSNIAAESSVQSHLQIHGGSWQNPTTGLLKP